MVWYGEARQHRLGNAAYVRCSTGQMDGKLTTNCSAQWLTVEVEGREAGLEQGIWQLQLLA